MKRFYKNYSVVPYITTVKSREEEYPHFNKFSYPPEESGYYVEGGTYGTVDMELDSMELPY